MTINRNIPTVDRVKELLQYCRVTGELRRLVSVGGQKKGSVAGTRRKDGYIVVSIDGCLCYGHRLAWVLTHGEWPAERLDHRDVDPSHNPIDNLRLATHPQNLANRPANSNNTSGFKGVSFAKSRAHYARPWRATIKTNGRQKFLGLFATPDAAHAAYVTAATKIFGEFARAA